MSRSTAHDTEVLNVLRTFELSTECKSDTMVYFVWKKIFYLGFSCILTLKEPGNLVLFVK